jgi:lysosomal Pro-X carboxypeptidase
MPSRPPPPLRRTRTVFFYFGNEDNVELYVNHTGLMWESAAEFKALLVFGEHRYYGETMPYPPRVAGCMDFLTTEQAMADFAYLIDHVRSEASPWSAADSAFVGFGGS